MLFTPSSLLLLLLLVSLFVLNVFNRFGEESDVARFNSCMLIVFISPWFWELVVINTVFDGTLMLLLLLLFFERFEPVDTVEEDSLFFRGSSGGLFVGFCDVTSNVTADALLCTDLTIYLNNHIMCWNLSFVYTWNF